MSSRQQAEEIVRTVLLDAGCDFMAEDSVKFVAAKIDDKDATIARLEAENAGLRATKVRVVGEPDENGMILTKTHSGSFPWVWEREGRYWEPALGRPQGRWRDGTWETGAFKQAEYQTLDEAFADYPNALAGWLKPKEAP